MCEYDQTIACYYDIDSLGLDGDVEFYVEEAQRAGSRMLELGCGTGRILLQAAEAGVEVMGLDISEPMLEIARAKIASYPSEVRSRITLQAGDMRDFDLGRTFNIVAIPYRAFMHLLTPEDQRNTLRCANKHLVDGGRLVLNFFDPRLDNLETICSPFEEAEFTHPDSGRRVISTVTAIHNKRRQILACDFTYREIDDEGKVVAENHSPITLRWVYRHEMEHMLELCGFEIEGLYGDFKRGPFKYGGEQIWVCRKKDSESRSDPS